MQRQIFPFGCCRHIRRALWNQSIFYGFTQCEVDRWYIQQSGFVHWHSRSAGLWHSSPSHSRVVNGHSNSHTNETSTEIALVQKQSKVIHMR